MIAIWARWWLRFGLPLRPFIWKIAARLCHRTDVIARGRTWFGAQMECDLADLVPQRIFYTGVWEPQITRLISSVLAPNATFIDLGAHIGYYSLLASQRVGAAGKVIAVEPWPATANKLRHNINLNGARNIRVIQAAVGPAPSMVLRGGNPNNSATASVKFDGPETVTVPATPLIDLVGLDTLAEASVIKMDIEAAEAPILRDLLAAPLRRNCLIVTEVNPAAFEAYGWPLREAIAAFEQAGFQASAIAHNYDLTHDWLHFEPGSRTAGDQLPVSFDVPFDLVLRR